MERVDKKSDLVREHVVFAISILKNFEPPPTMVAQTRKAGEKHVLKQVRNFFFLPKTYSASELKVGTVLKWALFIIAKTRPGVVFTKILKPILCFKSKNYS